MVDATPAKARRLRERQELRRSILEAARAIAAAEGWSAVTTRRVAETVAYSHPTIYEFFDSKDALLAELNREGYRRLLTALCAARAKAAGAERAIQDMAQAYCAFAWQHRELFEVMHGLSGAPLDAGGYHAEAQAVLAEARDALAEWSAAAGAPMRDTDDAVHVLWAALHGIASLALAKQIPGGKRRAAALAYHAVDDLLSAWRVSALSNDAGRAGARRQDGKHSAGA